MLQDVTAVNLINQHGSEGVLAKAFDEEALRFAKTSSGLRLVPFDFHKQCGASKYHKCVSLSLETNRSSLYELS